MFVKHEFEVREPADADEDGNRFFVDGSAVEEADYNRMRFEYDVDRSNDVVSARYVGESPMAFPHLDDPRFARSEGEYDAGDWTPASGDTNPAVMVENGDVIRIDRYSAEERGDFEIVGESSGRRLKADVLAEAVGLGLDVSKSMTIAEIQAAIDGAGDAAGEDQSDDTSADAKE